MFCRYVNYTYDEIDVPIKVPQIDYIFQTIKRIVNVPKICYEQIEQEDVELIPQISYTTKTKKKLGFTRRFSTHRTPTARSTRGLG